jgi:hypothetical protein
MTTLKTGEKRILEVIQTIEINHKKQLEFIKIEKGLVIKVN